MTFFFHPEAEDEFFAASQYYEGCEKGLGADFMIEVYSAIQNVMDYPAAWTILDGDVRRYLINRFPFAVVYSIEPSGIFILAVMNLHRDPDYWKQRR
jgi:hypothetical protein